MNYVPRNCGVHTKKQTQFCRLYPNNETDTIIVAAIWMEK